MNCVGGGGRYNVVLRNSVGIAELQCDVMCSCV